MLRQKKKSYIKEKNVKRGKSELPSFIFKTSATKAHTALNMNKKGTHFLHKEFFDGKRKRHRGLVALTASVYYSLLIKQVTLAITESESENTENVTFIWTPSKEVLEKLSQNIGNKFDPVGWCADKAYRKRRSIWQRSKNDH